MVIHVLALYMGNCFAMKNKMFCGVLPDPSFCHDQPLRQTKITHVLSLIRELIVVEALPYKYCMKLFVITIIWSEYQNVMMTTNVLTRHPHFSRPAQK